jgi:UDP-N-acetylglucosamine--N-acetylmuramyl-(pentapeptide) pyrophosphoryl-undecaprenol N-acetylglucosamine transferase
LFSVRQDIIDLSSKKEEAFEYFKIKSQQKVILVLGGSLGAKSINDGLLKSLDLIKGKHVKLLWQVGSRFYDSVNQSLDSKDLSNVSTMAFIKRMDLAYAAADLVISRAGALSISEITLVGKASILIPSPNVSEDHQTKNAMALVYNNAAILVKDSDTEKVLSKAIKLLSNQKELKVIADNAKKLGKPKATEDILSQIFNLTS